jgi:hypothetical protein
MDANAKGVVIAVALGGLLVVTPVAVRGATSHALPASGNVRAGAIVQRRAGYRTVPTVQEIRSSFSVSTPVYVIGETDLTQEEVQQLVKVAEGHRQLYLFIFGKGQPIDPVALQSLVNSDEAKDRVVHPTLGKPDGVYLAVSALGPTNQREWQLHTDVLLRDLGVGQDQFFDQQHKPLHLAQVMIDAKRAGANPAGMAEALMGEIDSSVSAYEHYLAMLEWVQWLAEALGGLTILAACGVRNRYTTEEFRKALADLEGVHHELDKALREAQQRMDDSEFDATLAQTGNHAGELNETEKLYCDIARLWVEQFLILEAGKVFQEKMNPYIEGRRELFDRLSGKTAQAIRALISTERLEADLEGVESVPKTQLTNLIEFAKRGGAGMHDQRTITLPGLLELAESVGAQAMELEARLTSQKREAQPKIDAGNSRLNSVRELVSTLSNASEDGLFAPSSLIGSCASVGALLADAEQQLAEKNFVGAHTRAVTAAEILSRLERVIEIGSAGRNTLVPELSKLTEQFRKDELQMQGDWARVQVENVSKALAAFAPSVLTELVDDIARQVSTSLESLTTLLKLAGTLEESAYTALPADASRLFEEIELARGSQRAALQREAAEGAFPRAGDFIMLSESGKNPEVITRDALAEVPQIRNFLRDGSVIEAHELQQKIVHRFAEARGYIAATERGISTFRKTLQKVSEDRTATLEALSVTYRPRVEILERTFTHQVIERSRVAHGVAGPLQRMLGSSEERLTDGYQRQQSAVTHFVKGEVLEALTVLAEIAHDTAEAEALFKAILSVELSLETRTSTARSLASSLAGEKTALGRKITEVYARSKATSSHTAGASALGEAARLLQASKLNLDELETKLSVAKQSFEQCSEALAKDESSYDKATTSRTEASSAVRRAASAVADAAGVRFTYATVDLDDATTAQKRAVTAKQEGDQYLTTKQWELAASKFSVAAHEGNKAAREAESAVSSARRTHETKVSSLSSTSSSSVITSTSSSSSSSGFTGGSIGGSNDTGFTGGLM